MHVQDLAAAPVRHEGHHGLGLAALAAVHQGHQRVVDLVFVENAVHRPAEADPVGSSARADSPLEHPLGLMVVQQDAAVEVAHQDSLRDLGHQRGQRVLLVLEGGSGFTDAVVEIAPQLLVSLRQDIQAADHVPQLGRTLHGRPMRRIGDRDHARVLGQGSERMDVAGEDPVGSEPDQDEQIGKGDDDITPEGLPKSGDDQAIAVGQVGPHRAGNSDDHADRQHAGDQEHQHGVLGH